MKKPFSLADTFCLLKNDFVLCSYIVQISLEVKSKIKAILVAGVEAYMVGRR
jgi:hypothetical protein